METFCTEGLTLSENIKILFKPDFKPIPKRTFTFISFLNVPLQGINGKTQKRRRRNTIHTNI